jgi:hypothetical protein
MITLTALEKSRLHCNIARVLQCTGDTRDAHAKQAWAFLVSHLDIVDLHEAFDAAESIADLISDAGGHVTDFEVSLKTIKNALQLDETTASHGLMLLGAVESNRDSDKWSTGAGASAPRIGEAA